MVTVTVLLISMGFGFLSLKGYGYHETSFIVSLGVFLVALLLAIIRGQLLNAKKIDAEMMIFKGAKPPFLDSLPEYAEQ